MFDIRFSGETVDAEGEILHLGVITLGKIIEGFSASFSFWSEGDYQKQWHEAAARLLQENSRTAFITCMVDPISANYINWWPAWRHDKLIIFQEHLLFLDGSNADENRRALVSKFSIENPYAAVGDLDSTHCEECRKTGVCRRPRLGMPDPGIDVCPSEWGVQFGDIEEFLTRGVADSASS